jgi:hypothetical protein
MKRKWTILLLALLLLLLLAAWFEPTHCVRGWLRGEAFYQGRPTSFWALECRSWWAITFNHSAWPNDVIWAQRPGLFDRFLPARWQQRFVDIIDTPPLLRGDPDAEPVLRELLNDPSPQVQELAETGLKNIRDLQNQQ